MVLHKGGVPSKGTQPQVAILLGSRMLSVQWKAPEKIFSEIQAATQGIAKESLHYAGYSKVVVIDGFHWGSPQVIHLDVECTGKPKVKHWFVATYKGKVHQQFNSMYVCTLKVARDCPALHHSHRKKELQTLATLEARTVQQVMVERAGGTV
jgi:hypothetical protein